MTRSLFTALAATVLAAPPLFAVGQVISLDLPVLPAGKTLCLEYDTTVQALAGDTSPLSTQATIAADGPINIVTDDPDTGAVNDPTETLVFENTAPTNGPVTAGNVGAAEDGDTSYSFTVVYMDDGTVTDIDVSSIDGNDFGVTTPGGVPSVTMRMGSEPSGSDGSPKTATYSFTPPGGSWDASDNGTYTISLTGMQVADVGSGPPLFVAANPTLATFTVNIPDPSYTIVALDADKPEGNTGNTDFTFTVSRGGDTSSTPGSVDYTITGADAADFSSPLTGTLPFPMGSASETLTLQVLGDTDVEGDEAFTVTLGNPMPSPAWTIGTPASAGGTIQNDDATVTVAVAPATMNEDAAGVLTYTFTRAGATAGALTVNFDVGGDATFNTDYTQTGAASFSATAGTVTFGAGSPTAIVTIDPTVDTELEPDEPVSLAVAAGTGYTAGTPSSASASILNDDVLTVEIAATDADADENAPDPGNFRVTRNSSTGPLEVQIQLDPTSTATPASDFSLGGVMLAGGAGAVTIPDGSTFVDIPLIPVDDIPAEVGETATLEIAADPAYQVGVSASETVTIAANDFVVTNTNDFTPGPGATGQEGTLRQATLNANALGGDPTISFSDAGGTGFSTAPQTINLSGGQLLLTSNVTVDGPAAPGRVTINAGGAGRVMRLQGLGPAPGYSLARLTIVGGETGPQVGGGLLVEFSDITLLDCIVEGNRGSTGGGMFVDEGTVDIVGSTFRNNNATAPDGKGGGLFISNSALSPILVRGSTISNNEADGGGGAWLAGSPPFSAVNCTISGNRARGPGGGIFNATPAAVVLDHVTITDNHADSDLSGDPGHTGGGVFGPVAPNNSILAGNVRDGALASDIEGSVDSNSSLFNLIGVDTGVTPFPGPLLDPSNQVGTAGSPIDPLLGPLSDNGGPTQTHAILPGSPAQDTGDPAFNPAAFTPPLDFDQRGPGFVRVFNGRIDIGAFELPNVPPMVGADNATVMVDEGSEATNTGTFSDTAGDTVTITADIGSITMQDPGNSGTWSWSYTPDDGPLMPTVTITATDALNEMTTTSFDLDVKNVAPMVAFDPVTPIDENGIATLTGTISDPGVLDTFTLDIDWGDPSSPGNTEQFMYPANAGGSQMFTITHQYLDDNPSGTPSDDYTISATVTDNDGGNSPGMASVTVNNVAPVVELDPLPDIDENGFVTLSGTITDPGTLDSFEVEIDWGDPLSPGNTEMFSLPAGTTSFSKMHTYLDDNPSGTGRDDYTIQVTVTDDDTLGSSDSESFQISNVRPQLTLDPVLSIDENGIATLTGMITDPGTLDTFSVFVDWGDPLSPGNYEMPTFGPSASGSQAFTLTHKYPDDNPSGTPQDSKSIFVLLLDDEGASAVKVATVEINNVAPEITSLDVTPIPLGVTLDVDFTDPGTDTHSVQILWGDGSSTPLTLPLGDRSFQASHSYAAEPPPGGYPITVTVTDDDTGSDTDATGPPAPPKGPSEIDEAVRLPNGDFRIGFSAMTGEEFQIFYSHDLVTWFPVMGTETATGNRVQWTDEGPPGTMSEPSSVPRRFYRYEKLGGMMPPP